MPSPSRLDSSGTPAPTIVRVAWGTLALTIGKDPLRYTRNLCRFGRQSKLPVNTIEKGNSGTASGKKYSVSTPEGIVSIFACAATALNDSASARLTVMQRPKPLAIRAS